MSLDMPRFDLYRLDADFIETPHTQLTASAPGSRFFTTQTARSG
ncbi:hypothetical protein [Ponticoccus alexandrii]|nr:hypothetical protein [Ponticoccus alexandrii]